MVILDDLSAFFFVPAPLSLILVQLSKFGLQEGLGEDYESLYSYYFSIL